MIIQDKKFRDVCERIKNINKEMNALVVERSRIVKKSLKDFDYLGSYDSFVINYLDTIEDIETENKK